MEVVLLRYSQSREKLQCSIKVGAFRGKNMVTSSEYISKHVKMPVNKIPFPRIPIFNKQNPS